LANRRHSAVDAVWLGNFAVAQRHVEINAQENDLILERQLVNGFNHNFTRVSGDDKPAAIAFDGAARRAAAPRSPAFELFALSLASKVFNIADVEI
jgi:hypothetical protein